MNNTKPTELAETPPVSADSVSQRLKQLNKNRVRSDKKRVTFLTTLDIYGVVKEYADERNWNVSQTLNHIVYQWTQREE